MLKFCYSPDNLEHQLAGWGEGINFVVVRNEINSQVSQLIQGDDKILELTGKAVQLPNQHQIKFAPAGLVHHFPCYRLFGSILKFLPDKLDEITRLLRIGLASDNVNQAEDAILGLFHWFRAASESDSSIPLPPEDLFFEVGVIIATRRKGILHHALQVARWIFSSGSAEQRHTIAQSTLQGLRYLIEELDYNREHDEEGERNIPLLRWGCAHLALAMSASGYETDPTVKRWAEVAMNDPLPEVRHAENPASSCTDKGKSSIS